MAVLSQRHRGYVSGVVVLFLGVVAFVVGFATPHWSDFTYKIGRMTIKGHSGLWTECFEVLFGESKCRGSDYNPEWVIVAKVLLCLALAGMAFSLCFVAVTNFMTNNIIFNRVLEVLTAVSACLGIAGASTYAAKSKKDVDFVNDLDKNYSFDDFGVSWAFGLTITGCVLNLCAATLIALYNRPTAPANPGTTLSFSAAVTGSAPVVVPGTTHVYQQQPGSNPYSVAMVQSTSPPPAYYPGLQAQGPTQPVVVYTADPQGKN